MTSIQPWLTLTDLGKRHGLSAVSCGRMLSEAGMRDDQGLPSDLALNQGFAYRRPEQNANRSTLWHEDRCGALLHQQGHRQIDEQHLVLQWADLLAALEVGSPSIDTSAAQMAEDLPRHLVPAVNERLQLLGSDFQVTAVRTAASGSSGSRTAP
jgi:hypothetical protein